MLTVWNQIVFEHEIIYVSSSENALAVWQMMNNNRNILSVGFWLPVVDIFAFIFTSEL